MLDQFCGVVPRSQCVQHNLFCWLTAPLPRFKQLLPRDHKHRTAASSQYVMKKQSHKSRSRKVKQSISHRKQPRLYAARKNRQRVADTPSVISAKLKPTEPSTPPNDSVYALNERDLNKAVDRLLTKYSSHVSVEEAEAVRVECVEEMGGLFSHPSTRSSKRYHHFFRARLASTFQEGTANDPAQYSYLPNHMCTEPGRCHLPGHTVFYGSTHLDTAVREVRPNIGDLVASSNDG